MIKKGSIVVWHGGNPCIGVAKEKRGDCWELSKEYDSCHESYLILANKHEKERWRLRGYGVKVIKISYKASK